MLPRTLSGYHVHYKLEEETDVLRVQFDYPLSSYQWDWYVTLLILALIKNITWTLESEQEMDMRFIAKKNYLKYSIFFYNSSARILRSL